MADYDKNCWRTPDSLFIPLHAEFNFGLDAAASHGANKCEVYIPPELDSLVTHWGEFAAMCGVAGRTVWLNPPFNPMTPWADRALEMHDAGLDIVMISNAATGTTWFRKLADRAAQVRFTTGRIAFVHPETGEPVDGNNMAQTVFVLSHTRRYSDRVVWFDV